jgi:hypothetical protein
VITTLRMRGWRNAAAFRSVLVVGLAGGLVTARVPNAQGQTHDPVCLAEIGAFNAAWVADSTSSTPATKQTLDITRTKMFGCVRPTDSISFHAPIAQLDLEASRLTKGFFGIPEYHDEGRLPTVGDQLGPLAHIYASPYLGAFTRRAQISELGMPGLLAALVVVELDNPGDAIPSTYTALGLEAGINCVWLYLANAQPNTKYQAFVSTQKPGTSCDRSSSRRGPFSVVAVRHPRFNASSDYPPVARFDVDASEKLPVLAFKCLAAFCEVGPAEPKNVRAPWGLKRPDPNKAEWHVADGDGFSMSRAGRRVRVIKGWHDEQHLAVRIGNQWTRLKVRATLIPEPSVSNFNAADFLNTWTKVASLVIDGDLVGTKYARWRLRTGSNDVRIQSTAAGWHAEIYRGDNDRKLWINTGRMLHYDAAVPPTARFRWTRMDDGIWVPCGNACCNSDGGGS